MNVLFIGAHPDDIEFGCGATIVKHIEDWNITCAVFSQSCLIQEFSDIHECQKMSLNVLGVKNTYFYEFTPSSFHINREEVWQCLQKLKTDVKPDIIYTHDKDQHQDHEVIFNECLRTFFEESLITYHIIRSAPNFAANLYESVDKQCVDKKMEALSKYHYYQKNKSYFNERLLRSKMIVDGYSAGVDYAEVFRVEKLIW